MSRTTKFGIEAKSVYPGPPNSAVYVDGTTGRLESAPALPTGVGGTGADTTTVGEGVARVTNGVWSFGTLVAADLADPYVAGYVLSVDTVGVLSWVANSGGSSTVTVVDTSPYTVLPTDMTLSIDARNIPVTIDLPLISSVRTLTVIDTYGSAMDNNITIRPFAGNTILGSAGDVIIATPNMAATFQSISTVNWVVVAKN